MANEVVMPYGVTVEATGEGRSPRVVTKSPHVENGLRVVLPDGPCRVAASWDGPESVRLTHAGHGYPVIIPAGGVPLRDCHYRRDRRGNRLPRKRVKRAAQGGRARHYRGLSDGGRRVAARKAVV